MDASELVDRMEEDIVFGVYPMGSKLVEERLSERYGASRYMLRSAMTELANQGMLDWVRNRGAQVAEPAPETVEDQYQVREILETNAAQLTPLPANESLIKALEDIQLNHEKAIEDSDYRRVFRLNIAFHAKQFEACPNKALQQSITEHARKVHVVRGIRYGDPNYFDRVRAEHRAIINALKGDDTEAYVAAVRAHLPASSLAYRRAYELRHGRRK